MNPLSKKIRYSIVSLIIVGGALPAIGQTKSDEQLEVFELSPFTVSTENDHGYYASNSISGSRIDVRIQDMPLTIEVVTSEFIDDTGSTDLRESLRYSAGILLQSQNDAYGSIGNNGGVNNPEGATGAKSDTGFKIRGFVTDNTLRKGFRRQHSTDSINIDRVEVVRGPSALLYGVGNFGGVVNYLPKTPLPNFTVDLGLGYGSDGWQRASLDVTGPIAWGLGYRVTGAFEDTDDWTESKTHTHNFFSPVLQGQWYKTKVTLDFEIGSAEDRGVGFKSVRAPTLVGIPITDSDRLETYGFLEFEGKDPRTFRWSGPDTFYLTDAWNANIELEQGIIENMYVLIGYNKSNVKYDNRDIFGGIQSYEYTDLPTESRILSLLDTIQAIQIIDGANSDVQIPVENAVLQYKWTSNQEETNWDQLRAEFNYSLDVFEHSDWFASKHSILLGYSWESQKNETLAQDMEKPNSPTDDNSYLYKNPTDSSIIRFDSPTDGTGTPVMFDNSRSGSTGENKGVYAVYSARFFDDRLFFIGGMRSDTSSNFDGFDETNLSGRTPTWKAREESEVTKETTQWGVSYEFMDGWTVYAVQAGGVNPNYDGVQDGNGIALPPSVAKSTEIGLKVNLAGGKISATISAFKIKRDGVPVLYWWAPAPARGIFDANSDIIYRMNNAEGWFPEGDNPYLSQALDEWNTAISSGAVFKAVDTSSSTLKEYTYLNASTPEGAAYLDRVFEVLNEEFAKPRSEAGRDADPWPGWLYEGIGTADSNINFATQDRASDEGTKYYVPISDESQGWELQVIWSPIDEFQLVLNYSNISREVTSPGALVSYPYAEGNWDRWAAWYFPNANWGLAGVDPNIAYPGGEDGLPNEDTASWSGVGWGKGESLDDTPKHAVSWWASWTFQRDSFLDGLQLGFGGSWTSEREYASAYTTAGQLKQNETGTTIKAYTDPRWTLNGMIKYSWKTADENLDWYVQLNVDNFLDDTKQYGLLYAEGLSWRFQSGISF